MGRLGGSARGRGHTPAVTPPLGQAGAACMVADLCVVRVGAINCAETRPGRCCRHSVDLFDCFFCEGCAGGKAHVLLSKYPLHEKVVIIYGRSSEPC